MLVLDNQNRCVCGRVGGIFRGGGYLLGAAIGSFRPVSSCVCVGVCVGGWGVF
jgi:hypothetical protein